ncbi:MAG TPA: glycosyltransferase family 4 protein [Terriglobia bacterium]|nr:glycosyltransferase family 4 protein [Terriglobia bacterium]
MSMHPRAARRILMTVDTVGGVWTYAMELAGTLCQGGAEILLASMGRLPTDDQRQEAAAIPSLELRESCFKLEWMENPWEEVRQAGDWLLELEDRFDPDVVHLNGYTHATLPWEAPVIVVAHSCVLSWWKAVKGECAPASWNYFRSCVEAGLRAAEMVIAPTRAIGETLRELYGEPGWLEVIPNGRNPALFKPGTKGCFVFSAGRLWDEAKNIAALGDVSPGLPWPVYVAGETSMDGEPAAFLRNLRPVGRLSSADLASWLARAPIFALPARYEPFGLTALEAALSGCALVLGDIPTLREIWDGAAWFVGPDDRRALSWALGTLIAEPATRAIWAARSRQRALQYSHERMSAAYMNAYSELASQTQSVQEVN